MHFLAQQDLIHKLGRRLPGVERFVLSSKKRLVPNLFTMTVKTEIDGHKEPVDIECTYISFCYEIKLEPSG